MISRTYFTETFYDMPVDVAHKYANVIRDAIINGTPFEGEKKKGFYLSRKGVQKDGRTIGANFEDKLYVGNIHRIENHLYWNDEELQEDDQIVDVIVIDGPVTRDGDGCSYGSKDHRDQILYANTIPQVVGHVFIINTPGGAASSRIDYEQAIADCREKGKPTVAWVDGLCASAGQLLAALCDRTVVMNGRHTMGCIGTMCAFWGVANGTVSQDGFRYVELVSVTSPDKNAEYREACDGKTEKLQAELDRLGEEFRETVRQNRPLVKEEHLTGKTFDADEVMGELVDEIGSYERAIECVFELADEPQKAARFMTAEPKEDEPGEDPEEKPEQKQEGQQQLEQLSEQQRGAVAASRGDLVMADDGHVTKEVQGFFGPETKEIAKPQNQENMTEKEMKAQEAEAAQAAEQQPAEQQEEAPAGEQAGEGAGQQEEAPAGDGAGEGAAGQQEEAPAGEGAGEQEHKEEEAPAGEQEGQQQEEAPAGEGAGEQQQEEAPAGEGADAEGVQQALQNAEQMIADKDKQIAEMKDSMDGLTDTVEQLRADIAERDKTIEKANGVISAKDAEMEKMRQQIADLKTEVKELSGEEVPMVDNAAGIPADNGTGDAPKQGTHQRITRDMSYEEIRAAVKKG